MAYMTRAFQNSHKCQDVWDGTKARKLKEEGWFANGTDIGLILSTDGGALFKRTGINVWPIWGIIANLPPE